MIRAVIGRNKRNNNDYGSCARGTLRMGRDMARQQQQQQLWRPTEMATDKRDNNTNSLTHSYWWMGRRSQMLVIIKVRLFVHSTHTTYTVNIVNDNFASAGSMYNGESPTAPELVSCPWCAWVGSFVAGIA